ncbi:MAG: thiamine-phosphate kinase [Bacteroidota bacterium]
MLSKFNLIHKLKATFPLHHPTSIQGIGDDAAVIDAGTHYKLATTDILAERVHFDLTYHPLKHLGYKAVTLAVSNIVAMYGIPEQILVNMAINDNVSLPMLQELYEGIHKACTAYQVDLVGSDTTVSATGLMITVTALGSADKKHVCFRKGAQVNDIICVTGDLGAAYLGLQVLNREKQVWEADPNMQPVLEPYSYMVRRQLKPEARTDIVQTLQKLPVLPTCMIDIADGLCSELLHISKAANVGVAIYEDKLPIDQGAYETAVAFHLDPITCAVNGGEDYELLFTIRQQDVDKVTQHPDITPIGYVTAVAEGVRLVTKTGTVVPLKAQGWQT